MKLLYVANQRLPTEKAYGIQIAKMCEVFALAGWETELVYPYRKNLNTQTVHDYYRVQTNFKVKQLFAPDVYLPGILNRPTVLLKNVYSAIRLFVYVLRRPVDVIYSRDELPAVLLGFFRNNVCFEAHKFSSARQIFYWCMRWTHVKIVAISSGVAHKFLNIGFPRERIIVVPDGVDFEQFNIPDQTDQYRKELGLPLGKKIIGYVGHFTTMGMDKGLSELLEAFAIVHGKHPETILLLVGGRADEIQRYRIVSERLGLGDDGIFVTWQPHYSIPKYLKSADILVMPFPNVPHYATYMSPLKLFEYMASGRPIVATDLPAIHEVLNRDNSIIVSSDSVHSLADGLQSALDDPRLSTEKAAKAKDAVRRYTWNSRVGRILYFLSGR